MQFHRYLVPPMSLKWENIDLNLEGERESVCGW